MLGLCQNRALSGEASSREGITGKGQSLGLARGYQLPPSRWKIEGFPSQELYVTKLGENVTQPRVSTKTPDAKKDEVGEVRERYL